MKVVGRSDGGLMGGRKDRGREGQGQYGLHQRYYVFVFLQSVILALLRQIFCTCVHYEGGQTKKLYI